jgi:hypothetical protein
MPINLAFQIDVVTNSDGLREIVNVDYDSSTDTGDSTLDASQIDEGAWEFRFVVSGDFDESEPVFRQFLRYGIDPATAHDACREAVAGNHATTDE